MLITERQTDACIILAVFSVNISGEVSGFYFMFYVCVSPFLPFKVRNGWRSVVSDSGDLHQHQQPGSHSGRCSEETLWYFRQVRHLLEHNLNSRDSTFRDVKWLDVGVL